MSAGAAAFTVVAGLLLVLLPRRLAAIPLLLAATYTTRLPLLELGSASLSPLRILVVVGIARVLLRRERPANGLNTIDSFLFAWALLLIGSSVFHTPDAWTYRSGMVLGEVGVYVLCRIFIRDSNDLRRLFAVLCVTLLPLAALMLLEKHTAHNYFSLMGGTGEINIRDGHVRAYGPFAHSILAGTVGATCLTMAIAIWRTHRVSAVLGLLAGAGIVFASTSSSPIMMVVFASVALLLWKVRSLLRPIRWATVAGIIALDIVMKAPVYFLMARIDITGSSTGWHRAQLIRSSIEHLHEWWAVGTDYTRHWMASGVPANSIHTDITNHFLAMGVLGGLPLLLLFVLVLTLAFRTLGRVVRNDEARSPQQAFLAWTLGSMLFAHVMNLWSIALFDQSVSFLYLILAAIPAMPSPRPVAAKERLPVHARRRERKAHAPRAAPAIAGRAHGALRAGRESPENVLSGELLPNTQEMDTADERWNLHHSRIRQRRGGASAEPPLVAWPAEWRT